MLEEFAHDSLEMELANKHGYLAGKLHTALHEVVGHASGQINPGVGQPSETLKNYAQTGSEYTKILNQIITQNRLTDFEPVKLVGSVKQIELSS